MSQRLDRARPGAAGHAASVGPDGAVQVVLSHIWLHRYGYGPVEGVLRAATNATAPTWRRQLSRA